MRQLSTIDEGRGDESRGGTRLAVRRRPQARPPHADRRHAVLTRAVQEEVIPRLLMGRPAQRTPLPLARADQPGPEQAARLVNLLLVGTQSEVDSYVQSWRDRHVSVETLLLGLLTHAARLLGQMWEEDSCTFSDVTLGTIRLARVMRLLGEAGADHAPLRNGPRALLVPMPGEQHGFGLDMVALFFRRAGWNVRQFPIVTSAELIDAVRRERFDIVGISVACSDRMEALAADIRAIRRHTSVSPVGIMVGGPPFLAQPHLAHAVGADATAADARQSVQQAQRLIGLLARAP